LDGQGLLKFYESGAEENPAGFKPTFRLNYDPGSYEEIRN
jgi:hypothetical protein